MSFFPKALGPVRHKNSLCVQVLLNPHMASLGLEVYRSNEGQKERDRERERERESCF
jgi:hypothetical protein